MMTMIWLSVFLLAVISCSHASHVTSLTDFDFESFVADHELVVMKFFTSYRFRCKNCEELAPEFEKSAAVLKANDPPVFLAEIDCLDVGRKTCAKYEISEYPVLKVFKQGLKVFDYEGPLDADGMIKHVKSKVTPVSRELGSYDEMQKFLEQPEYAVVGFFEKKDSVIFERFEMFASTLHENFRIAHSFNEEVLEKYGYKNTFLIFQPLWLQTNQQSDRLEYQGRYVPHVMRDWVLANIFGLVGYRTLQNAVHFKRPLVVIYCEIDHVRNSKGVIYWRNRVLKVAEKFDESDMNVTFALSSVAEFADELSELDIVAHDDKPIAIGSDVRGRSFIMATEFTVEHLEDFTNKMLNGELKPVTKKRKPATRETSHVKTVVSDTFDKIVNDASKDVLIEFYDPSSSDCADFTQTYENLAWKFRNEESLVIAKMDVTKNIVPKAFDVKTVPTIYLSVMGSHSTPKLYEGLLTEDDMVKFLEQSSTVPLKYFNRQSTKTEL